MKKIINCETGEVVERELNAEEIAQQEIDETSWIEKETAKAVEQQVKENAKSVLLNRLGITAEEAKLLLN
jgi:hypothetical protein